MIEAERTIPHPAGRVFEFLSDLRNHWRLESAAFVELGGLDVEEQHGPAGGRVRLRGPLGLSREARTRVVAADPPAGERSGSMRGIAEIGRSTVGRVAWEVEPHGDRARVRLTAEVERASIVDRLVLTLGGEAWLRRVFARTLANLEAALR